MNILQKIKTVPFPKDQFMDVDVQKNQIYLHHTASSPDPFGVLSWWRSNSERVSTPFVIAGFDSPTSRWKDGDIIQIYNSSKWGWHLGLKRADLARGGAKAKTSTELNSQGIGIELTNWGGLTKTDKGFVTYAGNIVKDSEVHELSAPYRGFKFYQKYTDAQLENTRDLLKFLCDRWDIPSKFIGMRMFDICTDALQGNRAIYSHTSVRRDKSDVYPYPPLIKMLESL